MSTKQDSKVGGYSLPESGTRTAHEATRRTLAHYDRNADAFWEGTRDHDVDENRSTLLNAIKADAPFSILDIGCGPGRDLHYFNSLGHEAVGLEGSEKFAEMAQNHSGCEVIQQNFLDMDLPESRFHGAFANASLFHVPSEHLPDVLGKIWCSLKPGGVLFCSNPRGDNETRLNGERFGVFHDLTAWRMIMTTACFAEIDHYYRPAGKPRDQQPWLASLWRRQD